MGTSSVMSEENVGPISNSKSVKQTTVGSVTFVSSLMVDVVNEN